MPKEIITLEEAQRRLGDGVVICLEPEEVQQKKTADGKISELWVFDPMTGKIVRIDKNYFDVRMFNRGGYFHPGIYQEPKQELHNGERIIGQVVVQTMIQDGVRLIRVRQAKGLMGNILELRPSSLSKGELCDLENCQIFGIGQADCQRIDGQMAHFLLEEPFPVEEGMTVKKFIQNSQDQRSISALVAVGLLRAA